jgi:hypothetical protein
VLPVVVPLHQLTLPLEVVEEVAEVVEEQEY